VVLAIFYFLLILPAQRQRKKQQAMLAALKTGDRVITTGGIYGTIVGLRDDIVQLRIADQVKIEVARAAIAGHQPKQEENASS
jgi:preprotein translocase subunit YajC